MKRILSAVLTAALLLAATVRTTLPMTVRGDIVMTTADVREVLRTIALGGEWSDRLEGFADY
ncbi:MAG: hypothetical protein IKV35_06850, partial [Clostridia bacterium]|nr:hypothetical protein [Clostridia bacterium]